MIRQESALRLVWDAVSLVTTRNMPHQRATEPCRLHTGHDAIFRCIGTFPQFPTCV